MRPCNIAKAIIAAILLSIICSCSRRVTSASSEQTTVKESIEEDHIRDSGHLDISTFRQFMEATLAVCATVADSVHIHTETVTTLDAGGNVTGSTRTETADRYRTLRDSRQAAQSAGTLLTDSTANRQSGTARTRSEATLEGSRRTEATVKTIPVWERVLSKVLALTIGAVAAVIALSAPYILLRRWLARKRKG